MTDSPFLNGQRDWPEPFDNSVYETNNQAGLLDQLREANYDVIIARFLPPNSSISVNSALLEQLINYVNTTKFANNSYEENIIYGKSAGALAVNYTLLKMEKAHLGSNAPHHHTKLYISHEGEHDGANVPLGAQHSVEYLKEYHSSLTNYVLHYILTAPLSQEIIKYYMTATGDSDSPSHGESVHRTINQLFLNSFNHSKNTQRPNIAGLTRNISISNGQNVSDITTQTVTLPPPFNTSVLFSQSNHLPYHENEKHIFFERQKNGKRWLSRFSGAGKTQVFHYKATAFGNWVILVDKTTASNFLNLDNASGGTMFVNDNPMDAIVDKLYTETGTGLGFSLGHGLIHAEKRQFCFTPTIFVHAIKNYDPEANNYQMNYNFKEQGLMHQSKSDFINDISSNFYGYPHLAHSANHYTAYTPFDAIFCWDKNTEHVKNNEVTRNGTGDDVTYTTSYSTDFRNTFKKFILEEADYKYNFIQNKKYGDNSNHSYEYKADVFSPHIIVIGNSVTQRKDFKDAEVHKNGNLHCKAAKIIHIYKGFHAKAGSVFHAQIAPYGCTTTKSQSTANTTTDNPIKTELNSKLELAVKPVNALKVYPNPSHGNVTIECHKNTPLKYQVFDIAGKLIKEGTVQQQITLTLQKGIYILVIKYENTIEKQKLIIH